MVKSVKRCLHWHIISGLIYNSVIGTINLADTRVWAWVSECGGQHVHETHAHVEERRALISADQRLWDRHLRGKHCLLRE